MGTRPGIIKMAPVFNSLNENPNFDVNIVYTGQHYSEILRHNIWEFFNLPKPRIYIEDIVSAETHCQQLAMMMVGCEDAFIKNRTDIVLVCGDANTNLAAGMAARKLDLTLGHIESGLRSRDWRMPEEHNRVMLDHISDFLFAPTDASVEILKSENVMGNILYTGNTIVDAIKFATSKLKLGNLNKSNQVLFTCHRQENVDNKEILTNFVSAIEEISRKTLVIFPIHPRTLKRLDEFSLKDKLFSIKNIKLTDPLPYEDMIELIHESRIVVTDSGGLQEESCIVGTPCLTIRDNTERPETVEVGANKIIGTEKNNILFEIKNLLNREEARTYNWKNPFGDGNASEIIAKTLNHV